TYLLLHYVPSGPAARAGNHLRRCIRLFGVITLRLSVSGACSRCRRFCPSSDGYLTRPPTLILQAGRDGSQQVAVIRWAGRGRDEDT
ncbi:hypothetical protein, partial [Frankia sp. CcWB3]